MKKLYENMLLTCFVCLFGFCRIDAMQNIIIQNKMSGDAFVESFKTSGTVVFNQVKLVGESLPTDKSEVIQIGVVSPTFPSKDNYAVLSLLNKTTEEYEQVRITWGGDGTRLFGHYVVDGFYRVVQQCDDRGTVTFTFYDYDDTSIIGRLKSDVLRRLKINATSQQKQIEDVIRMQSGLKPEEIGATL